MRSVFLLCCFLPLVAFALEKPDKKNGNESWIRVRLLKAHGPFTISGGDISLQGKKERFLPASTAAVTHLRIARTAAGWEVRKRGAGRENVRVERSPVLAVTGDVLFLNQSQVPQRLLLFAEPGDNDIHVVGVLDLEEYLEGVLASEMPAGWPMEALKAQAVASRTYALFQIRRLESRNYHLESDVRDQVYSLDKKMRLPEKLRAKVRSAVQSTRGLFLKDTKGGVLPAYYHADCGGHTEEAHSVWKNGVRIGTTKDPYCPTGAHSLWRKSIDSKVLREKLQLEREIDRVEVLGLTGSGRAALVKVVDAEGMEMIFDGQSFRGALGFTLLKSTMFEVKKEGGEFVFSGRGFGHGVGLCQWGSRAMAEKGKNYREILSHYYPKARLSAPKEQRLASL